MRTTWFVKCPAPDARADAAGGRHERARRRAPSSKWPRPARRRPSRAVPPRRMWGEVQVELPRRVKAFVRRRGFEATVGHQLTGLCIGAVEANVVILDEAIYAALEDEALARFATPPIGPLSPVRWPCRPVCGRTTTTSSAPASRRGPPRPCRRGWIDTPTPDRRGAPCRTNRSARNGSVPGVFVTSATASALARSSSRPSPVVRSTPASRVDVTRPRRARGHPRPGRSALARVGEGVCPSPHRRP